MRRACVIIACICMWAAPAEAQTLGRASAAAHGGGGGSSHSHGSHYHGSRQRGRGGGDSGLAYLAYLWLGPIIELGETYDPCWTLADHPYAWDAPGYAVCIPPEIRANDPNLPPLQDESVQVRVEGGYVFDGVARAAVEARAMLPYRFEVDAGFVGLAEPQTSADVALVGMFSAHVGWRFAQDEHWQFRTLLGARTWTDLYGTAGGFDFRYGFEVFPIWPLVISFDFTIGNLNTALTLGGRVTVGFMLDLLELYVGYDELGIIPTDASLALASVGGPLGGLRLWF